MLAFLPCFSFLLGFGLLGGVLCESLLALLFCLVLVFLFACWCSFGFYFFVYFTGQGVVVGWVWGIFCLVVFRNGGKCHYFLLKF